MATTKHKPAAKKAPPARKAVPAKKAPARKKRIPAKTPKPGEARAKLEVLGIDWVCNQIAETHSLTAIAKKAKVSIGTLLTWLESDPKRSAHAREARINTAKVEDEKALEGIRKSKTPFELSKAKEEAHHRRWRASKIAPAEYGERVTQELTGPGGGPIETRELSDTERAVRLAALLARAKRRKDAGSK